MLKGWKVEMLEYYLMAFFNVVKLKYCTFIIRRL